jgi:hypothetical protein
LTDTAMESLSHTKWECKYHVVLIPQGGRKQLYGELRRYVGEVFRKLAEQKESRIEEGHLLPDHVPMMIAIPPKYAGVHQEEERDPSGHGCMESGRETLWDSISGRAVLGVDGGPGRSGDPGLHRKPGARGPAAGSDEPLALMNHRHGGPKPLGPH